MGFSPKVNDQTPNLDGFDDVTVSEGASSPSADPITETEAGNRIGRYKILQALGEGGCGTVFLAEQEKPVRRRVALKVIKLGMDTKAVIARFEAERQALALMDHFNIAKVLDAGSTQLGRPYFVMELVRGIRITDYCEQNHLSIPERLRLFVQVCHAIQHAHQKGIVHRDIKPSNILVSLQDGRPVPKVIDFGIAKATDQRLTDSTVFTSVEQIVGTPAYMSPEQAEMSALDIDTRTDIYSLGVLLYELLTGKTPFDSKELVRSGLDEMRKTIREKEPLRPSARLAGAASAPTSRASTLPSDLDWIVMKCLEKDRVRRYDTADGLAADIERFLNNEPILARPPSQIYKLRKLLRRNKAAFAALTGVAVALIGGLLFSTWQYREKSQAYERVVAAEREQSRLRQEAELARAGESAQRLSAERSRANEAHLRQEAQARSYAADMNLIQRALEQNNFGRATDLLNRHRPATGEPDLRNWEWRYLWQQCRSDALFTLVDKYDWVNLLEPSPDGKWLAIGERERGTCYLWDFRKRREVALISTNAYASAAAFSPREPLVAVALARGGTNPQFGIVLWDLDTAAVVKEMPLAAFCRALRFTQDGRMLGSIDQGSANVRTPHDEMLTLWKIPDGEALRRIPINHGPNRSYGAVISPDFEELATASAAGLSLIDANTGATKWSMPPDDQYMAAVTFSPDKQLVAASEAYVNTTIKIVDAASGKVAHRLEGHQAYVLGLAFSPDGKTLASSSADQTIRLWDTTEWKPKATLRGHRLEVWQVAWLNDNATLVSGCKDGSVMVWDATAPQREHDLLTFSNVMEWSFPNGGKSLLLASRSGDVSSVTGRNLQQQDRLFSLDANVESIGISEDGQWLAASLNGGLIQLWNVPDRSRQSEFRASQKDGRILQFLGTNLLAVFDRSKGSLKLLLLPTGEEVQSTPAESTDRAAGFTPDHLRCLILSGTGASTLWDIGRGTRTQLNLKFRMPGDVAFSPDGKLVAAACKFGFARIWDTQDWKETATFANFLKGVHSVAWSPDNLRLAVASGDKEAIKLWDVTSGEELLTLPGPGGLLSHTIFSPDGNTLSSKDDRGLLHLWRARSWEEIKTAEAN